MMGCFLLSRGYVGLFWSSNYSRVDFYKNNLESINIYLFFLMDSETPYIQTA